MAVVPWEKEPVLAGEGRAGARKARPLEKGLVLADPGRAGARGKGAILVAPGGAGAMVGAMNDRFLKACRREPTDCVPVWFMRQAGRYMEEYRQVRAGHSILEVCKTPELAAQVTLQPIDRFPLDAAIIFADILLPLEPMGAQLAFLADEGPVISNPVRDKAAVDALKPVQPDALRFVYDAIRLAQKALSGRVPLIGFAGAPFTLASYLIEGGSSRNFIETKRFMYHAPDAWHRLMDKLARVIVGYLKAQVEAGAQAVQLFDSWVGALSPDDYLEYVQPHVKVIFDGLKTTNVPCIHFGTGTSTLLELMKQAGGSVIGVDWRIRLDEARRRLGDDVAIQGNLDPVVLFAPLHEIERRVEAILRQAGEHPGFIFNLGHGILPSTPIENVQATIDLVHKLSSR